MSCVLRAVGPHARSIRRGAPVAERARHAGERRLHREGAHSGPQAQQAAGWHALPRRARAGARLPHRPGADGAGRLGPGGRPGGELVPPRAAASIGSTYARLQNVSP
eukprot:scaffold69144_cov69-Phaeocystis_antarctica.AAC.5